MEVKINETVMDSEFLSWIAEYRALKVQAAEQRLVWMDTWFNAKTALGKAAEDRAWSELNMVRQLQQKFASYIVETLLRVIP